MRPPARRPVALQMFRPTPTENPTKQLLAALQRRRKYAKLPPLLPDLYLQAQAEELACKKMSERVRNFEHEARDLSWKNWGGYYWNREDQLLSNLAEIRLKPDATHIGLHVIPYDLGGGVVLCTATKPSR